MSYRCPNILGSGLFTSATEERTAIDNKSQAINKNAPEPSVSHVESQGRGRQIRFIFEDALFSEVGVHE